MSRPSRRPVRVKRGNSTVTIYKAHRKKNGQVYREFKLGLYNIPTADSPPNLTLVAIANRAAKSGDKTGAPCHVRLVLMR